MLFVQGRGFLRDSYRIIPGNQQHSLQTAGNLPILYHIHHNAWSLATKANTGLRANRTARLTLQSNKVTLIFYPGSCDNIFNNQTFTCLVVLGGLGVPCSPLDPRFAGSNPAEVGGFFSGRKNPEHKSSGWDFKLGVPSLRF